MSVIKVEGISKKYQLGHIVSSRRLTNPLLRGWKKLMGHQFQEEVVEDFWALEDINFEVQAGEAVGIIGKNGAGKSTLLKILSRITDPTEGRIELNGRVSSLLEVGTGFNPELSGRENIFLNGSILGMSRREIQSKFDEIVAFAEVERFLDTPVKRYSSGMYVRLAFAVAAHLEPEILIVDEVLAVGDIQFQKKCLGKMENVGKEGRTVLFVSHNMQAIRQFCSRGILLDKGELVADDHSDAVIKKYLDNSQSYIQGGLKNIKQRLMELPHDPYFRIHNIQILQNEECVENVLNGEPAMLEIEYEVSKELFGLHIYFQLFDMDETMLIESINNGDHEDLEKTLPGKYISRVVIPADFLSPIKYELRIFAGIANVRGFLSEPIRITINVEATGRVNSAYPGYITPAKLAPLFPWEIVKQC